MAWDYVAGSGARGSALDAKLCRETVDICPEIRDKLESEMERVRSGQRFAATRPAKTEGRAQSRGRRQFFGGGFLKYYISAVTFSLPQRAYSLVAEHADEATSLDLGFELPFLNFESAQDACWHKSHATSCFRFLCTEQRAAVHSAEWSSVKQRAYPDEDIEIGKMPPSAIAASLGKRICNCSEQL